MNSFLNDRTPLEEYAARLALSLDEQDEPKESWSGHDHYVQGWELNREYWSDETQLGRGAWRESWGQGGFILDERGDVWRHSNGKELRNDQTSSAGYSSLSRHDLGKAYFEDQDNRIATFIRDLAERVAYDDGD
jgi:hypothetical protein